jgi:para-aminobenzoate synthetase component 1
MHSFFPYKILNKEEMIAAISEYASEQTAFLFVIDYKAETGYVIPSADIQPEFLKFSVNEKQDSAFSANVPLRWDVQPVAPALYRSKFDEVVTQIRRGNSFLVNLTQPALVGTNLNLEDLYRCGKARYKLWLKDMFTVLSPETFIKIVDGKIYSYPMKGTIDASVPDAVNVILNDPKEKAEHATIVDLIRNDLSMVADNVGVTRYRYVDTLHTNKGDLLQVSSEIVGRLSPDYPDRLGEIMFSLLPAGSISGAPKPKTLQIIEAAEGYDRGFYTGIFGWFDGRNLDSAVMIRFVEQQGNQLIFKSGGGITSQSDPKKEYEELIRKIYVPLH